MIKSALRAVDPYYLIMDQLKLEGDILVIQNREKINLAEFKRIFVIGAGKGAAPMALAIEELLGHRINAGAINVKYGHGQDLKKIRLMEAAHPILDENTLKNTRQMLEIIDQARQNDLVIVLITGGGSALLELLPEGITLQDLAILNQLLLSSGAAIDEINTIRKHLSLIKGGQLAKRIAPARTLSLILSDVIGDPLQSIASGPAAPDTSTFAQAVDIISKYRLENKISVKIKAYFKKGLRGEIPDTPDANDAVFKLTANYIIGNNALALNTLKHDAEQSGYKTVLLTDRVQGEAREIAKLLAGIIKSGVQSGFPVSSPGCILLGGEPTVTLSGDGKGGRNQEITLAVLQELAECKSEFYFCSFGTDGTDGPTDAAGAWIDEQTITKVYERKLCVSDYLQRNDSYHFFKQIDQLIATGPTRTNVMDLIFCLY
ncbi:MAG: glycerate kinase [Calditrichaceae bacterium]|nr:glycerate kinase [Calditrichaceae bacterium]